MERKTGMTEIDERKVQWLRVKGDRKERRGREPRRKKENQSCLRTAWKK